MSTPAQDPALTELGQTATDAATGAAADVGVTNGTEGSLAGGQADEGALTTEPAGEAPLSVAVANGTAAPEASDPTPSGAAGLFAPSSPSETATTSAPVIESHADEGVAGAAAALDAELISTSATAEDAAAAVKPLEQDVEDAAVKPETEVQAAAGSEETLEAPPSSSSVHILLPPKAEPAAQSLSPPPPVFPQRAPVPPQRKAPQTRLALLKQSVEKDPSDGEAWLELIADAEKKGDLEKTREVYTAFLEQFPDAVSSWSLVSLTSVAKVLMSRRCHRPNNGSRSPISSWSMVTSKRWKRSSPSAFGDPSRSIFGSFTSIMCDALALSRATEQRNRAQRSRRLMNSVSTTLGWTRTQAGSGSTTSILSSREMCDLTLSTHPPLLIDGLPAGGWNVARAAEDGHAPKTVPASRLRPLDQRRADMARVRSVREFEQQEYGQLLPPPHCSRDVEQRELSFEPAC